MIKNRKIELQSKTIRRLQEDNIRLNKENRELRKKIKEQEDIVLAAEKYRTAHLKALSALNNAKKRYNEAARRIAAKRKRGWKGGTLHG